MKVWNKETNKTQSSLNSELAKSIQECLSDYSPTYAMKVLNVTERDINTVIKEIRRIKHIILSTMHRDMKMSDMKALLYSELIDTDKCLRNTVDHHQGYEQNRTWAEFKEMFQPLPVEIPEVDEEIPTMSKPSKPSI